METRVCSRCHVEKMMIQFDKKKNGYGWYCKECVKEYNREYIKLNRESIKNHKKEYYKNNIFQITVEKAIKRAEKLNISCDSKEKLIQILEEKYKLQNGKCAFCGQEFEVNEDYSKGSSMTIDRNVPGNGYIEGNINLICFKCNTIKNDGDMERLQAVRDWLVPYYEKKYSNDCLNNNQTMKEVS